MNHMNHEASRTYGYHELLARMQIPGVFVSGCAHAIPNSFCASKKTVPDTASVHT